MVSDRLCALTSLTAVTADCCVSADVTAIPVKLSDESVHTRDSRAGLVQSITASDMITVISNVIVTETVFAPPNSTLSATPVADLRAQMDRINTPVTILIKRRARDKEHSSQPNSIPSQEHMTLFLLLSLCTLVAGDSLPPSPPQASYLLPPARQPTLSAPIRRSSAPARPSWKSYTAVPGRAQDPQVFARHSKFGTSRGAGAGICRRPNSQLRPWPMLRRYSAQTADLVAT